MTAGAQNDSFYGVCVFQFIYLGPGLTVPQYRKFYIELMSVFPMITD